MEVQAGPVFLVGVVVLILVYWAQWQQAQPEGLPLARHPAGLLLPALRRLWKNRRLVGALLVMSVISNGLLGWLRAQAMGRSLEDTSFLDELRALHAHLSAAGAVPWSQVIQTLPNWRNPLGVGWGFEQVLALVLAVTLTGFCWRRPAWLSPELHRRLPVLTGLVWLYAAGHVVNQPLVPFTLAGPSLSLPRSFAVPWVMVRYLLSTPWVALGLSLMWQMAQGRGWSLREALRDALRCWPAVMVLQAPRVVPLAVGYSLQHVAPGAEMVVSYVMQAVVLAGLFLPWIILGEGLTLGAAVRRHVALWRDRAPDLGLFLLRYFTLIFLPGLFINVLTGNFREIWWTWAVLAPLRMTWALLTTMIVALAYVELRKAERQSVVPVEAGELPGGGRRELG
jgi:hypothetical protein